MDKNFTWTGRNDPEDGENALRWHHIIEKDGENSKSAAGIIGFPCDLGVSRNKGRIGAAKAPDALRSALANLAWHSKAKTILDFGNVEITETGQDPLHEAQENLGDAIKDALHKTGSVLVLGGGHETAAGSFNGLQKFLGHAPETKIGIINLDAHFDLRKPGENRISSGTPFYQINEALQKQGQELNYLCLGISETANTKALFDRADEWNVEYMFDHELCVSNIDNIEKKIDTFLQGCDVLYLTLDLDVLPHWEMPAVSAPAAHGVSIKMIEHVINHLGNIKKAGDIKWPLADIVEFNPDHDRDGCGARVAARLCDLIIRSML